MITLANVKAMIPVDCDAYDTEINLLINAAKADLYRVGIDTTISDPLIDVAVATYVKKNFHNPPDYDALNKAYESMLSSLRFSFSHTRGACT